MYVNVDMKNAISTLVRRLFADSFNGTSMSLSPAVFEFPHVIAASSIREMLVHACLDPFTDEAKL